MYILNIIIHSEFLHDCHMYKFTWLYTVQVPSSAEFLLVNTISATEDMLVVSLKLFYYACNICRQVSQVVHSVNSPTFCNHFTLVDSWIYSNHSPQSAISHYSTLIYSVTFQFLLNVFFLTQIYFQTKHMLSTGMMTFLFRGWTLCIEWHILVAVCICVTQTGGSFLHV